MLREDKRFAEMHKFQEKMLRVPATSAAVDRVFSHGGTFIIIIIIIINEKI